MPFVAVKNDIIHSIKMEFNLSFHCNLSCAECSHNSPYLRPKLASLNSFRHDIRALEKVYRVGRFRFVGGEPLLHPQLLLFIEAVKDSGIAKQVQVCTNGSLLHRVDEALFRELDVLSISWYPNHCDDSKINRAKELCARYGTKLKIEIVKGFRSMNVDDPMEPILTKKVFDSCQIAHSWYCQTFFDGMFYLCSRPLFTSPYRLKKGLEGPDFSIFDGLEIHAPNLLERLLSYLARKDPLASCRHCLGTVGMYHTWRSLSTEERNKPEIISKSAKLLIDYRRMRYFYRWERFLRKFMPYIPYLSLARVLTMLRDAPYYRSRTWRPRKI